MSKIPVTAMIFTLNEEIHLPACLDSLVDFSEIIVIDSFSNDGTEQICKEAEVALHQHEFTGFGDQRNWAFDNAPISNDWVLVLDADERVPDGLADEIRKRLAEDLGDIAAFRLRRRFYMWGRWLKYSSLYPNWVVRLVNWKKVRYENRGHAETQQVDGSIAELENDLIDENLKGIDEWFDRQNRYSRKDAQFEIECEKKTLDLLELFSANPLLRRAAIKRLSMNLPVRPILYFIYSYIFRLGFLDGKDGLIFCIMKSIYQWMILVKKYDIYRVNQRQANTSR